MTKAIFFDFWGTLAENGTYSPLKQTFRILRVRMPFGQFAEQFERMFFTKSFEDQVEAFTQVCIAFNCPPKPFIIDKLVGVWNKNKLLAKLYPDTLNTLKTLKEKGFKLYLVSNSQSNTIEPLLEKFGMTDLFDGLFISYAQGCLKTDGLFDKAIEKTGFAKEDIISVGDALETDIRGAEKAGIHAILLDRRNNREFPHKVMELTELLDKIKFTSKEKENEEPKPSKKLKNETKETDSEDKKTTKKTAVKKKTEKTAKKKNKKEDK